MEKLNLAKYTIKSKKMNIPKYDIEYYEGISASYIDWIAGGNFDGYLVQKSLQFTELDNKVKLYTKVIDKTRYDDDVNDSFITGSFEQTDKDTITLTFENFQMRGIILGENEEILAFDIWHPTIKRTEVYKLKE